MPKKKNKDENKPVAPKMYIFCEGANTEPSYLKAFIDDKIESGTRRRVDIIIKEECEKNDPKGLVRYAKEEMKRNRGLNTDQYWVVFDRESIEGRNVDDIRTAFSIARDKNIRIAFSNVCFEVWLLLHFVYSTRAFSSCEALFKESELVNFFRQHGIHSYSKDSSKKKEISKQIYPTIRNFVEEATKRAKKLNKSIINNCSASRNNPQPWECNPYTDVYLLLEAIVEFPNLTSNKK